MQHCHHFPISGGIFPEKVFCPHSTYNLSLRLWLKVEEAWWANKLNDKMNEFNIWYLIINCIKYKLNDKMKSIYMLLTNFNVINEYLYLQNRLIDFHHATILGYFAFNMGDWDCSMLMIEVGRSCGWNECPCVWCLLANQK